MIRGRLGVVPYMNAKPLQFGLRERLSDDAVIEAAPSALADMLASGHVTAALVSSFACFRGDPIPAVSGICISSDGPVQSVRLFLDGPVAEAKRIGLHTASLSSAALAQIVLRERFGVDPTFVPYAPDDEGAVVNGYLLIGDRAMTQPDPPVAIDLGEEWRALTGLPFVYAVWGIRAGEDEIGTIVGVLLDAKRRGMANIEAIARSESARLSLDEGICHRYLTETIRYDLGGREAAGLNMFVEKCTAHGLAPKGAAIEFISP